MSPSIKAKNHKYTKDDRLILENYKNMVDAIGQLLGSSCEVVLHSFEDLNSSVIYIHNGKKTGRSVGSPVTDKALKIFTDCIDNGTDFADVYFTKNKQNHTMRSTSTIIKNTKGQPIGMLCINLDISTPFDEMMSILLPPQGNTHDDNEHFAINVEDLIISNTLKVKEEVFADNSVSTRLKIKEIIHILNTQGIFQLRDAVAKVADTLNISKDVIYLHLRSFKKNN